MFDASNREDEREVVMEGYAEIRPGVYVRAPTFYTFEMPNYRIVLSADSPEHALKRFAEALKEKRGREKP